MTGDSLVCGALYTGGSPKQHSPWLTKTVPPCAAVTPFLLRDLPSCQRRLKPGCVWLQRAWRAADACIPAAFRYIFVLHAVRQRYAGSANIIWFYGCLHDPLTLLLADGLLHCLYYLHDASSLFLLLLLLPHRPTCMPAAPTQTPPLAFAWFWTRRGRMDGTWADDCWRRHLCGWRVGGHRLNMVVLF